MRILRLIPALAVVIFANAAHAQSWDVFTNQENFFTANFPGTPAQTKAPYKTLKGVELGANVFTVRVPAGRLAGTYSISVVDYSKAPGEINTATEQAGNVVRKLGTVKYDAIENLDLHATRRLTVETGATRILAEILFAANNRLYISQADTPFASASPAQFQASLQILDDNGVRIRYRTVEAAKAGEIVPVTDAAREIGRAHV